MSSIKRRLGRSKFLAVILPVWLGSAHGVAYAD
ncbi:MAG: hypothetical protein RLZZ09_1156, partial [Pseudomonadota bacterium]